MPENEDDWRKWKDGWYDSRYEGVGRRLGRHSEGWRRSKRTNYYSSKRKRKRAIIAGSVIGIVLVLFFIVDWSEVLQPLAKELEEQKPLETAQKNIDEAVKRLQPLISDPYVVPAPIENQQEQRTKDEPIPAPEKKQPIQTTPQIKITDLEQEVHTWTNKYRKQNGLSELTFNLKLTHIARSHSQDMATSNYFSHDDLNGRGLEYRYATGGFTCAVQYGQYIYQGAENIWQGWTYTYLLNGKPSGYYTESELAKQIVDSWMGSKGHRENILKNFWKSEGIGIAITDNGIVYTTQNFC